jgi:hypothetical protein
VRPKGKIVYSSPVNPIAEEAKKEQRQERLRLQTQRAERAARPVPNYICYAEAFKDYDPKTGRWKGGSRRLPKCRVCECTLHPQENHVCEGFTPKFKEHDKESHQRFEARREMIRESRPEPKIVCSVCGEEMPEWEDGQWHWEAHEGRPEREHYAIDGEPDGDLDGYDDEPEEDYCEGDDDGWDCD